MNYNNKLLLITTLSFLLLVGCKESISQDTTNLKEDQVVALKKRPKSPPIKVKRELMVPESDAFPYILSETNFNEKGNITLITNYDYYGSGRKVGSTTNVYSPKGNLIKSTVDDDGIITYNTYAYNDKNQKIKESWKRDNSQGNSSQFTYNDHGDLIEEKVFTEDGKEDFSRVVEYEYDAFGNIIVEKKWEKYIDGNADLLQYHIVQEFTDNKLQLKVRYNEAGNLTRSEEYRYDNNNLNTQVLEGSRLGKFRTHYSYNEYGELTDEKNVILFENGKEELSTHNVTSYDKYGNNLGTKDIEIPLKEVNHVFEYEF